MGTIEKLQSLYQQLDQHISAGEDVVADLRKEINNLELSYLKDEVLPLVANFLGGKIKKLRCELDCNLQFNDEGKINYTFCTSGSSLMVKDTIDTSTYYDLPTDTPISTTILSEPQANFDPVITSNLRIVDYSEKAIAVYGDSRHLSDIFKSKGGYFNLRLKEGAGWVFSKKRRKEIEEIIGIKRAPTSQLLKSTSQESQNLFTQARVEDNSNLSEDGWIALLTNLKCMTSAGFVSPHKAIFIISIIDGIRTGFIRDARIYPTLQLQELYKKLWRNFVPEDWPFSPNIFHPYVHLSGERFYDIVKNSERAKFDININWNSTQANKYIKHGVLDSNLFNLLKRVSFAERVKDALIKKYLADNRPSSSINTSTNQNGKLYDDSYLSSFKRYLLTAKSKHGKPYSPSSVNVYVGGLKNRHIHSLVQRLTTNALLDNLDFSELEQLYEKLRDDANNGVISNSVAIGLRLYIEFRQSLHSDDIVMTKPEYIVSKPSKAAKVRIKSITAEHIHISGGTPTNMIVDFVNQIGPELVAQMHIPYLGGELVSLTRNNKYISASKRLNDGYWINTCSSTPTKMRQISQICSILGIDVKIEMGEYSLNETPPALESKRAMFRLNGHGPLNKRQAVLACVRLFMALNHNVPYEVVERNFPPELQGSYGVIAKLAKVRFRISHGYDDDKRYFLGDDQILKAKDDVEFVVCHQWGNQFPKFQAHVKKRFGWEIKEI